MSHEVEALDSAEGGDGRRQAAAKAFALLETYLREHGPTPETPEVMFQLAELKWEEAKSQFLPQMARVQRRRREMQRAEEEEPACRTPPQPGLDLDLVAGALSEAAEGLSAVPQDRRGALSVWVFAALRGQGRSRRWCSSSAS